jgi:hypothetical protein
MKPTQITHCEIPNVFRPQALVRAVTRTSITPSKAQLTQKVIPVMVQNAGFTSLKNSNTLNITGFTQVLQRIFNPSNHVSNVNTIQSNTIL